MAPRLGKALLTAIRRDEPEPERKISVGALLSPSRARLLQYYCRHPLSVAAEVVRATVLAAGTIRWHGSRLVETRWLERYGPTYYPCSLIDVADLPLLRTVSSRAARRTLASAFESPGQSVSELGRAVGLSRQATARFVEEFRSVDLLSVVEDGTFARVYPTRLLAQRREATADRAGAYCKEVLRRLSTEGLTPEVLRKTRSEFLVRYGPPGRRVVLNLPVDPFSSALIA